MPTGIYLQKLLVNINIHQLIFFLEESKRVSIATDPLYLLTH